MDQNNQDKTSAVDKVLAFDTIFTNNHIKMLKVLLSYFDPAIQKTLAIYIKFLELQYTFAYFQNHARVFSSGHSPPDTSSDLNNLCREILPYCAPDERKKNRADPSNAANHGELPSNAAGHGNHERTFSRRLSFLWQPDRRRNRIGRVFRQCAV